MHPHLVLPLRLADFDRRGFRTDRPEARAVLERAASSFLRGYNAAARSAGVAELHDRLQEFGDDCRGFGYEGAGMHAALADLSRPWAARAVSDLARGRGQDYHYLIHVGAGWSLSLLRSARVPRLPATPLVRWLALDGAGFGAVYFGGQRSLRRICAARHDERWRTRVAGAGRALWFVQAADVAGIARLIGEQDPAAAPDLWAGVGLACAYAGPSDAAGRALLAEAAGRQVHWLRQGVLFGSAARDRAGVVPAHTRDACRDLVGIEVAQASSWADQDCVDLLRRREVAAYQLWRDRLADRAARRPAAKDVA